MDKTILNNFLCDINVKHCLSNYQENNIFNILALDEIRHSRMLAWLLNPRASHHAGDYFLKALLSSATISSSEDREIIEGYDFFKEWPMHDVETYGLSSSIITTEFKVKNGNNDSIDIGIFSPEHEFMVFIENKTGSKEHSGQTTKYRKALTPLAEKLGWFVGYIFLDWSDNEANDPFWASINYDWLTTSLKSYIDKRSCNDNVLQLLSEYHDYLTDGINPIDQSQAKLDLKISSIANKHTDYLSTLQEKLDCSSLNLATVKNDFVSDVNNQNEITLYWQNYPFFDTLFNRSHWDLIKLELLRMLGNNKGYDFDIKTNSISVHNNSWFNYYDPDYDQDNGWLLSPYLYNKGDTTTINFEIFMNKLNKAPEKWDAFFNAIGYKKKKNYRKEINNSLTEQVNELVRMVKNIDNNIYLLGK